MNDLGELVLAGLTGILLGVFYFGGLWLTVRRLPRSASPELLLLGSFVTRTAIVLVGFYLVMAGRWERLLVCAVGFILVRFLLVARWGRERGDPFTPENH